MTIMTTIAITVALDPDSGILKSHTVERLPKNWRPSDVGTIVVAANGYPPVPVNVMNELPVLYSGNGLSTLVTLPHALPCRPPSRSAVFLTVSMLDNVRVPCGQQHEATLQFICDASNDAASVDAPVEQMAPELNEKPGACTSLVCDAFVQPNVVAVPEYTQASHDVVLYSHESSGANSDWM